MSLNSCLQIDALHATGIGRSDLYLRALFEKVAYSPAIKVSDGQAKNARQTFKIRISDFTVTARLLKLYIRTNVSIGSLKQFRQPLELLSMVKLICTTPDSEDWSVVFQIPYIYPERHFKQLVSSLWCQNIVLATIRSHRYFLYAAFALVWQAGLSFASCPSIGIAPENLPMQRVHC
jgi:hypothetical protein